MRTFVAPFDPIVVREALLRERYRGGQAFYVSPRIEDLAEVKAYLDQTVPEARVAVAHGQMPPGVLEDIMSAFYDGKYDVLLSTTIIESGLDIPTANTLIVHRADMFGLSQLYQLRGRVGRSKTRAYALFTLPANKRITAQAERRLKVLQSLDTLGAGFQLASHDLDIRGAGNLLGEEQSGHIKEVGFELYQQMLEEAVMMMKAGVTEAAADRWSPQITIGMPVLIPEDYVADLSVRLGLYRRLADIDDDREIDAFGAELADRFGPLPEEVQHLLKIVAIKALCRRANVEKVDTGPKGAVLSFRDNTFANPAGLLQYIREEGPDAQGAPGHEGGVLRRMGEAGATAQGHDADPANIGRHRGAEEGGVGLPPHTRCVPSPLRGEGWGGGSKFEATRYPDDPHPQPLPSERAFTPVFDGLWGRGAAPPSLQQFCSFSRTPAFAHTGETAGGFLAGLSHPVFGPDHVVAMVAVGLWGAFLGAARDLAAADRVPAGDGVRRRARHPRRAAAGGRDRHRILGDRARPDGRARGAPAALGRRRAGRGLRDLPRLRARQGIAGRRQCGRVLGRLRDRDRPAASHRHRVRAAGALARGTARGARGRGGDRARRRRLSRRLRMTAFLGGLTQFFIPSHLLAVVALGLLAGQHAQRFPLPRSAAFAIGLIAGSLMVASAIRQNPAALGLLMLAVAAASLVVLAWDVSNWLVGVMSFATGSALPLNAPPHEITIANAVAAQAGLAVAAIAIVALVMVIAMQARRPWQRIGVRDCRIVDRRQRDSRAGAAVGTVEW